MCRLSKSRSGLKASARGYFGAPPSRPRSFSPASDSKVLASTSPAVTVTGAVNKDPARSSALQRRCNRATQDRLQETVAVTLRCQLLRQQPSEPFLTLRRPYCCLLRQQQLKSSQTSLHRCASCTWCVEFLSTSGEVLTFHSDSDFACLDVFEGLKVDSLKPRKFISSSRLSRYTKRRLPPSKGAR